MYNKLLNNICRATPYFWPGVAKGLWPTLWELCHSVSILVTEWHNSLSQEISLPTFLCPAIIVNKIFYWTVCNAKGAFVLSWGQVTNRIVYCGSFWFYNSHDGLHLYYKSVEILSVTNNILLKLLPYSYSTWFHLIIILQPWCYVCTSGMKHCTSLEQTFGWA